MPENNERFNYQSELLRRERYHSLPLATEDLSNLRRLVGSTDTNTAKEPWVTLLSGKRVALKQCHADDSPKLTRRAQVSSSLHEAERPALPLLAQWHRKHQPELMVWLPPSALRELLDSLVRAPHSQRVLSTEPTESMESTEQRAE